MLAICRAKAERAGLEARVYEQEMQHLGLPRRYAVVLVPSSSFQLLLDPADATAAMARFARHLLPGGRLLMPFMPLWQPGDPLERPWDRTAEAVRSEDGATLRRWSRTWFDPETQLEHTEDRYEVVADGQLVYEESHLQSPAVRGYRQEQAVALYRDAGFDDVQVYSGFTWEPARPQDWVYVVIGRAKAGSGTTPATEGIAPP
jgi:hypothetical protein